MGLFYKHHCNYLDKSLSVDIPKNSVKRLKGYSYTSVSASPMACTARCFATRPCTLLKFGRTIDVGYIYHASKFQHQTRSRSKMSDKKLISNNVSAVSWLAVVKKVDIYFFCFVIKYIYI